MTGGVQTFVLIVALNSYGFTAGPYFSKAECEVARGVVVRALDKRMQFNAFCLPGAVVEKQ